MGNSRLTIVTPTLNQGDYIERTIATITPQLGPQDSYVIVDGGSSDSTHEVLRRWEDRITAVYIEPGCTQAEALALGFNRHPGKYACYLNSDDLFLPGAIDRALSFLEHQPESTVAVYSNRVFVDDADRVTRLWRLPPHINYLMRRWDYVPQEACFWRYDVMQQVGGVDEQLNFAMDYDLFVRMMTVGKFCRLKGYFACFREHAKSKTSTINATQGRAEVAGVQRKYRIRRFIWDRLIGFLLRHVVQYQSRFSRQGVHSQQVLQAQVNEQISGVVNQTTNSTF